MSPKYPFEHVYEIIGGYEDTLEYNSTVTNDCFNQRVQACVTNTRLRVDSECANV